MDHKQEVVRLFKIEYGERNELIFRFSAVLTAGLILYAYTGWFVALIWLGQYLLVHSINLAFHLRHGPDYSQADSYLAGGLFLAVLASFLWMPSYLMLQDDLALQVCGAAATASVLVFLVRRSDTLWFMVVGETAIVAAAVMIALFVTIPRVEVAMAQFAMILCSFGMVGYVAHAIIQNRRNRLDKEESERRLRQAYRLEAVGQLTGGVAHDFNNLLAVIQGNAELITDLADAPSAEVTEILRATQRGSELIHSLLAFSRRQSLKPASVDACSCIAKMSNMLERTLGEMIEIKVSTGQCSWRVEADQSQLENAILNLAINARDAMPEGGCLTINCTNVTLGGDIGSGSWDLPAGDYVVLSVADDGKGMTESIREQAFDPFFTTKEVGQGSGLGLSMVYGFAKQSGGDVTIASEAGQGTTVSICMPKSHSPSVDQVTRNENRPLAGQGEVILLLEDDLHVRQMITRMLEKLGYSVQSCETVCEARRTFAEHSEISLVLTDVVLPGGTNGSQFAHELKELRADLPIVLMSGYLSEIEKQNQLNGELCPLLSKPFSIHQLANAIRESLEIRHEI